MKGTWRIGLGEVYVHRTENRVMWKEIWLELHFKWAELGGVVSCPERNTSGQMGELLHEEMWD
jgi:hypothetical protein